jgi:hypothetical protein
MTKQKSRLKINQEDKFLNIEGLGMQLKIKDKVNLDNFVQFFLDVFAELILMKYKIETKRKKLITKLEQVKDKLLMN